MDAASLLVRKAQEYEQLAAHHAEVGELREGSAEALTAMGYTVVAIALREVAASLIESEELAA